MVDAPMQAYYARDEERDRLTCGVGRVEFALDGRDPAAHAAAAGRAVADIGGGPGRYTDWLVDAGYEVVHRDVVPHHVEQVRARHGTRVDAAVGDARALDLPDGAFDAVLLLGPLYHLTDGVERVRTLREARRVASDRGVVYAAAISRWAPRLHGMLVERIHLEHPEVVGMIDEVERSGIMPPVHDASFTGYAHTPQQLREEVEESGLAVASLVAVEGIAFALADLDARMDDPDGRALVLDVLRAVESVPALLGIGPHLLVTARTPPVATVNTRRRRDETSTDAAQHLRRGTRRERVPGPVDELEPVVVGGQRGVRSLGVGEVIDAREPPDRAVRRRSRRSRT